MCDYASRRKDALINHRSTHCVEKPFKCSKCKLAYKQKSSLRDHLRSSHKLTTEEIREILPPDNILPGTGFEMNNGQPAIKRKTSTSPSLNNSDVLSGSEMGAFDNGSSGNRTPSPLNGSGRVSPDDERSQIIKKIIVECKSIILCQCHTLLEFLGYSSSMIFYTRNPSILSSNCNRL